jgi:hypothetical protein
LTLTIFLAEHVEIDDSPNALQGVQRGSEYQVTYLNFNQGNIA